MSDAVSLKGKDAVMCPSFLVSRPDFFLPVDEKYGKFNASLIGLYEALMF